MSTSTVLTKAATTRLIQSLSAGLPPLPFPINWAGVDPDYKSLLFATQELHERLGLLTKEQQEANLLHVAVWVVERGFANFNMKYWHLKETVDANTRRTRMPESFEEANECGTAHCIGGFAQVMSGADAWSFQSMFVGQLTLGLEAARHFTEDNDTALEYLRQVVARNS
jgi:hypothetical protein